MFTMDDMTSAEVNSVHIAGLGKDGKKIFFDLLRNMYFKLYNLFN